MNKTKHNSPFFLYPDFYRMGWKDKQGIPLEDRRDLTVTELERLGVNDPYDLIDGRIIFKGGEADHAYFKGEMAFELGRYLEQNPIGWLFPSLSVRLFPDDDRQLRTPDLSFYLREHSPHPMREEIPVIAPDLAIELVSRLDPFIYILNYADLLLDKGSKVVWIVIPPKSGVLIWKADDKRWEGETLACPELLPGWSLDLKKFFASLHE